MCKLTIEIMDLLSDGEWHVPKEIIDRACAMTTSKSGNAYVAFYNMTEATRLIASSLAALTMTTTTTTAWEWSALGLVATTTWR